MPSVDASDTPEPARPDGAGRSASGAQDGETRTSDLVAVLEESRRLGFLGPGPVDVHIAHALAFTAGRPEATRAVDLGSGGGVPGLVLAQLAWPQCRWVLVDSMVRRCAFLREAVEDLGLED